MGFDPDNSVTAHALEEARHRDADEQGQPQQPVDITDDHPDFHNVDEKGVVLIDD